MAEGAPLLREYTLIAYRGFESLLLRQVFARVVKLVYTYKSTSLCLLDKYIEGDNYDN